MLVYKRFLFSLIIFLICKVGISQTTFQKIIPAGFVGGIANVSKSIPIDNSKTIVIGLSGLMLIDSNQSIVWKTSIGVLNSILTNEAAIQLINKNILLAATFFRPFSNNSIFNTVVIKLDNNGDTLWSNHFIVSDTTKYKSNRPISILTTSSNNVLVLGLLNDTSNTYKGYFIKTDSTGNIIWNKIINVGSDLFLTSTKITADGGIIAAGSVDGQTNNTAAIKLDSNGTVEWTMKYVDVFNPRDIIETNDGGFAFVATSVLNSSQTADVMLVKTDRFGAVEYAKTYGSAFGDEGEAIQQLPNNDFIIAARKQDTLGGGGSCFGIGPCFDFYLIKTTSLGDTIFTRMYGDSGFDVPASLDVNADGGFTIIGRFNDGFGFITGTYIVKTDSLGLTGNCNFTYTNTNTRVGNVNLTYLPISVTIDSGFATTHQPIIYTQQNIVGANTVTICSSTTVGINDLQKQQTNALLYPNPGNEQLTLETTLTQGVFEMYDLVGKLVLSYSIKSNIETINTAHLPKGTYIYRISSTASFPTIGKWIKN